MSESAPNMQGWALFLDVDGTLLELAETPQGVHVPTHLKHLLEDVRWRLDGALALVSGRSLANLDGLFSPLKFIASGVHGCERRTADGHVLRPEVDAATIARVRGQLAEFVRGHEGLLLEDKHYAVAMHFRRAPEMQDEVYRIMNEVLTHLGPTFALQAGKSVLELRPGAWTKGSSITSFMQEAPFAGRIPVFIGDDVTDEDAFEVVNEMKGVSIRVGQAAATRAKHRLGSVSEVLRWLQTVPPVVPPQPAQ
ncbi:trehalose-phosphatase [Steroidobacter agaridevorans]|uniref:trehalose-phosphatase n=1 Tax=Steroidobacter agaridevorans TaxID=2695856 RepID=UPI00132C4C4D|nr:trehalose-phosphatase [Steroidobacter agaridevorans]GFE89298.1 putative trehalose-phosphate phosphatase [Steroidobacter agaridevorans]